MSDDEFEINETGFPYNPRFSTNTYAIPTMRPLVNKRPSIPVVDHSRLYLPEEGKICVHKYYPEKHKQLLKQRKAEAKQAQALAAAQQAQAGTQEAQGEEDEEE